MTAPQKINLTRQLFLAYVEKEEPFLLNDLYMDIKRKECYFLLTPRLSIGKFIEILEFKGLINYTDEMKISITESGRAKIREVLL